MRLVGTQGGVSHFHTADPPQVKPPGTMPLTLTGDRQRTSLSGCGLLLLWWSEVCVFLLTVFMPRCGAAGGGEPEAPGPGLQRTVQRDIVGAWESVAGMTPDCVERLGGTWRIPDPIVM
uniref:Uncharacterized protein n=1 Tax=Knipowitschia caucasica TaxID=637954 RepID=A0AAV2JQJ8_KNICA